MNKALVTRSVIKWAISLVIKGMVVILTSGEYIQQKKDLFAVRLHIKNYRRYFWVIFCGGYLALQFSFLRLWLVGFAFSSSSCVVISCMRSWVGWLACLPAIFFGVYLAVQYYIFLSKVVVGSRSILVGCYFLPRVSSSSLTSSDVVIELGSKF